MDRYKKAEVLIITLSVLLFMVLLAFIYYRKETMGQNGSMRVDARATDEERKVDGIGDLSGRNIFFAGIEDTTIKKGTLIELKNLEPNGDFLMKYRIYEGDSLIFETDLIPSGQYVSWDAAKDLGTGEHKVSFVEEPFAFAAGEFIPLTSGRNEVNITIEE